MLMDRPDAIDRPRRLLRPNRLDGQNASALLGKLGPGLRMRVEQCEVRNDDRNRKCDRQDPGECAKRANEHSDVGLRCHVAVADRRHGDDCPPQANRYRGEVVVRVVLDPLGVVDERGEDDDSDDEEEDQQHELVRRRLERMDEDLESRRVAGQLEQAHDADDAEELENVVLLLEIGEQEVEVERDGRDEVDDVDRCPDEAELARTNDEPRDQLEGEPGVADALDVEERLVRVGPFLFEQPGRRRWRARMVTGRARRRRGLRCHGCGGRGRKL